MNKPVDLIIADASQEIYTILNGTGLPLTVMEFMIKDILDNVTRQKVELVSRLKSEQQSVQNTDNSTQE